MTHPAQRRVAQAGRDLSWVEANLGRVLSALAAQTPTGWPAGGTEGGRSDTHRGGPTANAAVAGIDMRERYRRIDLLALHVKDTVRMLADEVESVREIAGTEEAEQRAARCSGGEGEWADPTCQRYAVQAGLCHACIKRRTRYRSEHGLEEAS